MTTTETKKKIGIAPVGALRTSQNGYQYVKIKMTGASQWRLYHHVRMEEKLGRPIDSSVERVIFVDGNRGNLSYDNLKVVPKGAGPLTRRRAELEDRIRELKAQLDDVNKQLKLQGVE